MSKNKADVGLRFVGKDETKQAVKGVRGGVEGLKKTFLSLKTLVAGVIAGIAVKVGIDWVKAWGEAQKAQIRLNTTLRNTGRFSNEVSVALQQNASDLQKVTLHGDETIVAATASLAALAQELTGPELEQAQKAMIGLADQFFGGDLETAAMMLGKTIASDTNALSRNSIAVDVNASQQEKLQQILKQTGVYFENSKGAAQGVSAAMVQIGMALGDTKEEFGAVISQTLGLGEKFEFATKKVGGLNDFLKTNQDRFVAWGNTILAFLGAPFKTAWNVITGAAGIAQTVVGTIATIIGEAGKGIVKVVNGAIAGLNFLIRAANTILPKGLRLGEIEKFETPELLIKITEFGLENIQAGAEGLWKDLKDIAAAWVDIAEAADKAIHTQDTALTAGAGAGENLQRRIAAPAGPARPGGPAVQYETGEEIPGEVEIPRFLERVGGQMQDILGTSMTMEGVIGQGLVDAMGAFGEAGILAGEGWGDAMMGSIGQVAVGLGQLYQQKALAALADALLNPATAAASLAAAAQYQAAAAGLFALGMVGGAGGGRGGRSGGGGSRSAARDSDALSDSGQGEATLIIEGGFLDMNDPRQQAALARAIGQMSSRRVTIRGGHYPGG